MEIKTDIKQLYNFALEIVAKYQKNKDKVKLSPQSQQNLDKICIYIVDNNLLPESKFEQELQEFCFRFYSRPLPSHLFLDLNLSNYSSHDNGKIKRFMLSKTLGCWIWFLTYQIQYLFETGRSLFLLPSKVNINLMYNVCRDQSDLLFIATDIVDTFLNSINVSSNCECSRSVLVDPGLNGKNIFSFITRNLQVELCCDDIKCFRNLICFNRYDPYSWGSQLWQILHFISYYIFIVQTDKNVSDKFYMFLFKSLHKFLPCDICAKHWKQLVKRETMLVVGKERYIQLYHLHNKVRKNIGLGEYSLEFFLNKETMFYSVIFNNSNYEHNNKDPT